MTPLVTIAIPTRNRQVCAATLARAALDLLPDCQVVVSDNSDDESLRALLEDRMSDPRLSYQYLPGKLSVVDNFNATLDRCTGEYLTFFGDDDIFGPHFQDVVRWAKSEGIEAVLYASRDTGRVVHYFWSGVRSPRWGDMGGKLYFSRFGGKPRSVHPLRAMRDAVVHMSEGPRWMPRIYLGIVSRVLVERVRKKYGAVFGGFSPDIYSSHLLANECAKLVYLDYPFIIPGASPKSTSAAASERSDMGPGKTADEHLGRFSDPNWDPRIPNYYSGYTIWSQTLVQAHAKTGRPIPLRAFAYSYATCLLFTPRLAVRHLPSAIRAHRGWWRRWVLGAGTMLSFSLVAATYVVRRIPAGLRRRPAGAPFVVTGLADSRAALDCLASALGRQPPDLRGEK